MTDQTHARRDGPETERQEVPEAAPRTMGEPTAPIPPWSVRGASAAWWWKLMLWWSWLWGRPRRKPYHFAPVPWCRRLPRAPPGRADGTALALERARSVRGLVVEVDVVVVLAVGTVDNEGIYRAYDAKIIAKAPADPRQGELQESSTDHTTGAFDVILESLLDGVKNTGGWASVWEWLRRNGRAPRGRRCRAAAPPV